MILREEWDHLLLRVLEEQLNVLFVSRPKLSFISRSHLGEKFIHPPTLLIHKWRCRNTWGLQAHFRPKKKNNIVKMMLGLVANYCPGMSRSTMSSMSLANVWRIIRQHYGFQTNGSPLLDFDSIRLEPEDRPEYLFQRLSAFIDDSLLCTDTNICHHGSVPTEVEVTPKLENLIVFTWLRLLHPAFPKLVKQRYRTELRLRNVGIDQTRDLPSIGLSSWRVKQWSDCEPHIYHSSPWW